MEIGPARVSGWARSRIGGCCLNSRCSFSVLVSFLPPLAAVIWEVLRKLGLRPGYDWALSALAVRVVFWQERTVPGLHQPGGLVENVWGGDGRFLTWLNDKMVLNSASFLLYVFCLLSVLR